MDAGDAEKLCVGAIPIESVLNTKDKTDILNFYNRKNCRPKIYLSYDRKSYTGTENPDLRITFDTNLKWRRENLSLKSAPNDTQYFTSPTYIVEIKTSSGYPKYLVAALNEHKIYPQSFSKYGKIYEREAGKTYKGEK